MADGVVVVTGANGFVGTALWAHFRNQRRAWVGAVRTAQGEIPPDFRAIGDLEQATEATLDALLRDATAIVHLAGRAHVMSESELDPERAFHVANAEVTARLARAASRSGVRRFILASTVKVNGEATPYPHRFGPADAPDPQDAYARSKLAAERALFEAADGSRMVPIVLRLPLVYGPGVKGNFALLVEAVVARRLLPVGAIRNRRSLLYVGNLVDAIDAALDSPQPPSGVHFVADAEPVSTPELVRAIAAGWEIRPRVLSVPVPLLRLAGVVTGRRNAVARLVGSLEVDASSFRAATDWTPRWSLGAALANIVAAEKSARIGAQLTAVANTIIRRERPGDIDAIAEVTRDAFRSHPHSNRTEQFIIDALRRAGALTMSLVAERAARVVGHIAFSPVAITDSSSGWFGLGPLSVAPKLQRQGIGQALVLRGLAELRELDARGCVVLGDPLFYGRFGFANDPNLVVEGVKQEYFLALAFGIERAQGEVAYHASFNAPG